MKCAVCGKEFGTGNNCQHCGSDKFTGLGNYCGYNAPFVNENTHDSSVGLERQSLIPRPQSETVGSMICYACGEIIPSNSEYCPYCSKELYVNCPKCGNTYSSQFPACNKCGTNRNQYLKEEKEREQRKAKEQARLEQLQRQQQQKTLEENKENFRGCFTLLGYLGLIFGVVLIIVTMSEHGSENFRINQGKELTCYLLSIAIIVSGLAFIFHKKLE